MVGIVIVSHSKKLAQAVIELCQEMKRRDFPLLNGSGTSSNRFGSDPLYIKEVIERAYTKDGVIIFGDLGSSILNSEMAVEFLDETYDREKIRIADAPLVEGALMAVAINDEAISLERIQEELENLKTISKI